MDIVSQLMFPSASKTPLPFHIFVHSAHLLLGSGCGLDVSNTFTGDPSSNINVPSRSHFANVPLSLAHTTVGLCYICRLCHTKIARHTDQFALSQHRLTGLWRENHNLSSWVAPTPFLPCIFIQSADTHVCTHHGDTALSTLRDTALNAQRHCTQRHSTLRDTAFRDTQHSETLHSDALRDTTIRDTD